VFFSKAFPIHENTLLICSFIIFCKILRFLFNISDVLLKVVLNILRLFISKHSFIYTRLLSFCLPLSIMMSSVMSKSLCRMSLNFVLSNLTEVNSRNFFSRHSISNLLTEIKCVALVSGHKVKVTLCIFNTVPSLYNIVHSTLPHDWPPGSNITTTSTGGIQTHYDYCLTYIFKHKYPPLSIAR